MISPSFAVLAIAATLLPGALAHGYVPKIQFGSKTYTGPKLTYGQKPSTAPSILRQTENGFPLKGANNQWMSCGLNAHLATEVANVMPGDTVKAYWTGDDGSKAWPHDKGPILTYLGSCGNTKCTELDGKNVKWFKIDQTGKDSNGNWASKTIFDQKPYTFKLPANLAAGNYLLRSEVIALHFAYKKLNTNDKTSNTGAEFYPSCSQIKVGGSQTGAPTSKELVTMPGAYSDSDPGIYIPDFYSKPNNAYVFPGPPIAAFVSGKATEQSLTTKTKTAAATTATKKTTKTSSTKKMVKTSTNTQAAAAPTATKSSTHCKRRNVTARANVLRRGHAQMNAERASLSA